MNKIFLKRVLMIATPIVLQQFVISTLNMVDVFMISSLSNEAIAGVGGANKLYFVFNLFLFGMCSGSSILTAQYWGAKDEPNIKRVYGFTVAFGGLVSLFFAGFAIFTPEWVMSFFATSPEVIRQGSDYLRFVGLSFVFNAVSFATVFTLRSTNEVRIPLIVSIIAIGLNTVLNWILIFGHFGLPELGVQGAAIATLISRILEMVILLVICKHKKLAPSGKIKEIFGFSGQMVFKILRIAGPAIINEIIWSTGVTMYAVVYGRMGTEVMSAMTIFQTIEQMVFVLIIGLSNAAAIILGNTLGEDDLEKAYREAIQFLKLSLMIGIFLAIIIAVTAPFVTGLFPLTPTVHKYVLNCLYIMAIVIIPRTINTLTVVGILRSGGDTLFTALIDGVGVWVIGVPLAFLSGIYLQLDIWFVLLAISMEEVMKVVVTLWRTFSKKWICNLTEQSATSR